jgi:hypothetical protein
LLVRKEQVVNIPTTNRELAIEIVDDTQDEPCGAVKRTTDRIDTYVAARLADVAERMIAAYPMLRDDYLRAVIMGDFASRETPAVSHNPDSVSPTSHNDRMTDAEEIAARFGSMCAWGLDQRSMLRDDIQAAIDRAIEAHTPTQWAYDQACATIEKHRARADAAEVELAKLKAKPRQTLHLESPTEIDRALLRDKGGKS